MSEVLTVTLPDDVVSSVRASVEQGRFASPDEAIADALRDWADGPDNGGYTADELRAMIRKSDASGPGVPAEQVYADLDLLIDEYRTAGA